MDCLLPSYQQRHSVGTQGRDGNEPTGKPKPREKRAERSREGDRGKSKTVHCKKEIFLLISFVSNI